MPTGCGEDFRSFYIMIEIQMCRQKLSMSV